jgi:hypothetical protein
MYEYTYTYTTYYTHTHTHNTLITHTHVHTHPPNTPQHASRGGKGFTSSTPPLPHLHLPFSRALSRARSEFWSPAFFKSPCPAQQDRVLCAGQGREKEARDQTLDLAREREREKGCTLSSGGTLPTGGCTPPVGSPHWGVHAPQWGHPTAYTP